MVPDDNHTGEDIQAPAIEIRDVEGHPMAVACGDWTLRGLCRSLDEIRATLRRHAARPELRWDLCQVRALDNTGALILWQAWGRRFPDNTRIGDNHRPLFENWLSEDAPQPARRHSAPAPRLVDRLAMPAKYTARHLIDALFGLGRLTLDSFYLLAHPRDIPWRQISATIYLAGVRALPVAGLLGVLLGMVFAYQAALNLRAYGAGSFAVNMLGFAMVRELGPLITAILVAGRSGSSMTAEIGVMRLTEELDAMMILGIPLGRRLIFPKVVALFILMPLLTLWAVLFSLAGGAVVLELTLGMGYGYMLNNLPPALPLANLWIGLGKAAVFGALIAMTASHFGLRIKPNTRSLAAETTRSVVTSIALVLLVNSIFTVLLQDVGFRG